MDRSGDECPGWGGHMHHLHTNWKPWGKGGSGWRGWGPLSQKLTYKSQERKEWRKKEKFHGPVSEADWNRTGDGSPRSKWKCQLWDRGKARGHGPN